VLGIWGDPEITGKPVFSDLRSHKKSLPVTFATTHGGAVGRELAAWLAGEETSDEAELVRVAGLVEAAGGREWATTEAERRMTAALRALAEVAIPEGPRTELSAIARFIVTREA
jgi:geranylgeranyl diphosphate synthase type I